MKNLHKAAMIVGVVAMLGLGLLLCFVPAENHDNANADYTYTVDQEP